MSKKKKTAQNAVLAGVAADTVRRFGGGIKEHLVALDGVDNEAGTQLKRSLARVEKSRVNPEYQRQNLKQQAGFSAEIKIVARKRAEEAIAGKNPATVRTDDIPGHVNDELYDIAFKIDADGNPDPAASMQVKFVGNSPESAVEKMLTAQYQKYHDRDVKISVPSDYFPRMKAEIHRRTASLEAQIKQLQEENASPEIIAAKQKKLNNCRKLDKNLYDSKLTNEEAMEARLHPMSSTVKDIVNLAHRSGIEQAKAGMVIGGGVSLVKNFVDVCNNKKTFEEAASSVTKDTAGAAVVSYATTAGGSVIKGFMQNSSSSTLRAVSKTNAPAYMAVATLEAGKTLTAYFKGDIDTVECLDELGEKGYCMVNSAMYAAVGQAVIPVPIVGAMVGSMVGCALSSASYDILKSSLMEAKISGIERQLIERECREHIAMLQEYKAELERMIAEYMAEQTAFFNDVFHEMQNALEVGDVDKYIEQTNNILINCGKTPMFKNQEEFDVMMALEKPLII